MEYLLACILVYLLYVIGIQYERGGAWRVLLPFTVLVLLLSWAINQTIGRLVYGKPLTWRETFSKHTSRMVFVQNWRGRFARLIAALLNFASPNENHV